MMAQKVEANRSGRRFNEKTKVSSYDEIRLIIWEGLIGQFTVGKRDLLI